MSNFVHLSQSDTAPLVAAGHLMLYSKTDNRVYYTTTAGEQRVPLEAASAEPFPVSSIFISVSSANPASLLGYGTWVAFAVGKMLVGLDAAQAEFDTVEETGGAKTVTQTAAQMAVHTHTQDPHNHTQDAHAHSQDPKTIRDVAGAGFGFGSGTNAQGGTTANATATNQAATATNQNAGGTAGVTQSMPILNPYIVVYMWKRTA